VAVRLIGYNGWRYGYVCLPCGAKLNRMKMELITVEQQAKHLKKHLPKSWKRFVNQRILEHKDNNVTEPFKCFDEQYWKDVYSALANER